jgi:GTPase
MLLDRAKIHVEAGRGGDGEVSFRREAHVPRGGPDGGDGGRGGDVVLVCDDGRRDLGSIGRARHFRAERGERGRGKNQHGARGPDVEIRVPPGTVVEGIDGGEFELLEPGTRIVVANGGSGGHGNKRFTAPTRQAPRFAEKGLPGEEGWIELRLKLLADAGLIGLPNAGKSSLLAALTRATPKIGAYPFTTLEPHLGTIQADDTQLVLADIPGLIEGAAEGAGLGHEFLAHIERCRLLIHLVDIAAENGEEAYATIRGELAEYGGTLGQLPEILILSKSDLLPPEEVEAKVEEWRSRADAPSLVLSLSAATGAGLDDLRREVVRAYEALEGAPPPTVRDPSAEPQIEHKTYRPGDDDGFEVVQEEDDAYRITGRGIEILFMRHDTGNTEAMAYVEQRLREIGVIAELKKAGFVSGDDVRVGELEMELHVG